MLSGHRGLLYVGAWLPLFGLYILIFLVTGMGGGDALSAALANVLPAAVLGVGVLSAAGRIEWRPGRSGGFFAVHALLAAVYGVGVAIGHFLLIINGRWMATGVWDPSIYFFSIMPWIFFIGLLVYCIVAGASYTGRIVQRLREEEGRAARAEAMRSEAELRALRAQLNPHFLFNTLHSLLALVREDPRAAEEALEQFGDLLHYTLRSPGEGADEVTLREEWEFVRNYLELERLRLEDRLRLHTDVEAAALGHRIPALSLQPLVENAVRHAIACRAGGGNLWIAARVEGADLVLQVRDDGPGASPENLGNGTGLGLRLVRQRLEMLHGDAARFEVQTAPGEGFQVTVRIPAQPAGEASGDGEGGEERWRSAL